MFWDIFIRNFYEEKPVDILLQLKHVMFYHLQVLSKIIEKSVIAPFIPLEFNYREKQKWVFRYLYYQCLERKNWLII